jgi:selenocysteine lyase/cysteine desulfurase
MLCQGVYGNPHSDSQPSRSSTDAIEAARERILNFFDVESSTHEICFTANTSAAIKLVAESYPFTPQSLCLLSADNHNSVNGLREYARRGGARVRTIRLDGELRLRHPEIMLAATATAGGGLFAFPAQSNFSGVQHPLSLIDRAHEAGLDVLLDIAAYAPSHRLSLRDYKADFAALSFYKMFGYPTGVGALIARRDALQRLRRPWFAGGTIVFASVEANVHRLKAGAEGFEDGTPSFLSIAALDAGFDLLATVGMDRLSAHVDELTAVLLHELGALQHRNGLPMVTIYGPGDLTDRGGTVAFNLLDGEGNVVPFQKVEKRAQENGVAVRGGCFCNPGASEAAFALQGHEVRRCLEQLGDGFSIEAFSECLGKPVGAVRASVGLANRRDDIDRLIEVVASFEE